MIFNCFNVSPEFPGTNLQLGSYGSEVARMQKYLDGLRVVKYPTLINLDIDGSFGANTKQCVELYQGLLQLTQDGIIGKNTWDDIVKDYNDAVGGSAETYPGIPLVGGMTGEDVQLMQEYLNDLADPYTAINTQTVDGIFGTNMMLATQRFQAQFGLTVDGTIGPSSWNKIVEVHEKEQKVVTKYPGYTISQGDSGDDVRFIQSYVNVTRSQKLTVDGIFGQNTYLAIGQFQKAKGIKVDGIVGEDTWADLVKEFNKTV